MHTNGRPIKLKTTLAERRAVLDEKNELVHRVVDAIRNERAVSAGDMAVYHVFQNSEWRETGLRSIENVNFVDAAAQFLRYVKPDILEPWMEKALRHQLELYKTFILIDIDNVRSRGKVSANI